MKFLKILIVSGFALLAIITAIMAYLVLGIDPNSFKPELEKLASNNEIELSIEGDIGWSWFPVLAIEIESTQLFSSTHNIPQTQIEQVNLSVDWGALLDRQVRLRSIAINGLDIQASSTKQAATVAAAPAVVAATSADNQDQSSELPFQLAIHNLSINDGRITLKNEDDSERVIDDLQLNIESLNLEHHSFPVRLEFTTEISASKEPSHIELTANAQLDINKQQALLNDGVITIDEPSLAANFKVIYDGSSSSVIINPLQGQLQSTQIEAALVVYLHDKPSMEGTLSISPIILSEWLGKAPPVDDKLSFSSSFSATPDRIKLAPYQLSIGEFTGSGNLVFEQGDTRQLELDFTGNTLDLTNSNSAKETEPAALLTPLLAPLALLDGGKGHIEINLDAIKLHSTQQGELQISQPRLNLFANQKRLHITDLSGKVFSGQFRMDAKVDLSQPTPSLFVDSQLKGIDVQQALPEQQDISGLLNLSFTGTSKGDTADILQQNLQGSGQFLLDKPIVQNLNIERSYCEMAALIEKENTGPTNWSDHTSLDTLKGNFQFSDNTLALDHVNTAVGNLAIKGNGKIELKPQHYDMLITTHLNGSRTSENGCLIKSKRIRNRDIPLRCKGSYAEGGSNSCLPDEGFVKLILQEKLAETLSEKLFKTRQRASQEETEAGEETATPEDTEKDNRQLDKEELKNQAIDTLLRGILNQ